MINQFTQFMKNCWKQVSVVVGVIAIVTSILAFDARYAKSADIDRLEGKIVSTLQEFKKSLELQRNIDRLTSITDQLMKIKFLLKQYPKDKELKEDYENLKIERDKLQLKVEKGTQ